MITKLPPSMRITIKKTDLHVPCNVNKYPNEHVQKQLNAIVFAILYS